MKKVIITIIAIIVLIALAMAIRLAVRSGVPPTVITPTAAVNHTDPVTGGDYTVDEAKAEFVKGCSAEAPADYCGCTWDTMLAAYGWSGLQDALMNTANGKLDERFSKAAQLCQ